MQIISNNGTLSVKRLSSGTIYSSEKITVSPDSATGLGPKGMVVLNGRQISLPSGFTWPTGASLLVRDVNQE
jgi:translation elongation factor EF-1alpha